jgi:DNA repair protein RadC
MPHTPSSSLLERIFTSDLTTLTLEELFSVVLDIPATHIRQHLSTLFHAPSPLPRTLPGLTSDEIARLVAVSELISRYQRLAQEKISFTSPQEVATFFQTNGFVHEQSHVYLLLFNAQHGLLNSWYTPFHRGSPTLAHIRPTDIYREAIRYQAQAVVVVHTLATHDPTPNSEALDFIRTVGQTASTLDIKIHDYLTVGTRSFHALSMHPDLV